MERPRGPDRVAHLTTVHRPFDPRIFRKQLGTLRDAGFDVHLVAPHDHAERRNGIVLHPLPSGFRDWHARLLLQPLTYRRARALDADLYQVHDPELLPVARLLKTTTGARVVYDIHENYRTKGPAWGRLLRALERWSFRWLDHVLLAERSYRSVVAGTGVSFTPILNYANPPATGAPTELEAETGSEAPRRLLYTGTVSNGRGLRTMVDLAAAVKRRGRPERVDVVGVCNLPSQRAAAEARIQEQGLDEIVTRVGWDAYVPPSAMTPYYRRADVGLFLAAPRPNYIESMPTKFYEYLQYGLPILCSDVPLWRRFVEENNCGAVVPPNNPEAVLDVLARWREQPALYRTYAENARAAASRYRWATMGTRLVEVYRDLLPSSV